MKVALAQMNSVTGDLEGNTKKIKNEVFKARKNGANLIIFPEMSITGYCISDLIEDKTFVLRNKELLEEIVKETKEIAAIIGFIDYNVNEKNEDGNIKKYNAAALIQNRKIIGIVHKSLLPNYRYFDDKRYFTHGEERKPLSISIEGRNVKLGISICEDMWDESYKIKPIRELVENGAEIIININASPFHTGKLSRRQETIKRHISYAKIPCIYVNTVGAADNGKNIIPFDGESLVYNANGELIFKGKQFKEETAIIDIYKGKKIQEKRKSVPEEEIFNALVASLKDYATQAGFTKAIVPLSGGIDSALGIVIATKAFGRENVTAYNLPSVFNSSTTKKLAKVLAKNLGVRYKVIPIQEINEAIIQTYVSSISDIKGKITKENLQARIRGLLMMLESNDSGSLLISNGNKTEIALGYSTLYGDMCGGISVIGDLSKNKVYEVGKYINQRSSKEMIPKEIFEIKPSAELSENQVDPFDYSVISPLVDLFIEERKSPEEIIDLYLMKKLGEKFEKLIYSKYTLDKFKEKTYEVYNLIKKSVYKRVQAPPIIAITNRAFGYDLRETLVNRWGGK